MFKCYNGIEIKNMIQVTQEYKKPWIYKHTFPKGDRNTTPKRSLTIQSSDQLPIAL